VELLNKIIMIQILKLVRLNYQPLLYKINQLWKKEVVNGYGLDLLVYQVTENPTKSINFEECKNLEKIKIWNSCKNEDDYFIFIENSKCVSTCEVKLAIFIIIVEASNEFLNILDIIHFIRKTIKYDLFLYKVC